MDREAIDTWLGRVILALVLSALIFGPLALGGVRASEFVVLQWLLLGVLAVWLLRIWVAEKYRFLLPPTVWATLAFVVYAVWRYRTADIEYLGRQEMIQVALAALLFLAVLNNLYGQTELRIVAISLIALGTLLAMYGIYQWLTHSHYVWHFIRPMYEGRGSGTYICPNHLAGFLEMVCPLAITFTVLRGFGAVARIMFAYASFVMLIGIAATGSRAGWMSAAVALAVLALILLRQKTHWWAALALVVIVGGTGTLLYSHVIEPRFDHDLPNQHGGDIRFRIWDAARQMWQDHPWIGVGPDHFDYRYRGYRLANWAVQPRPGRVHNDYWNTLADWGLIGFVLVLAPVAVAGVGLVRSWKNLHRAGETAGSRAALALGAAVGLIAILVHSFFDFNMHIPANAFLAATLLAILTAQWRFATQDYWLTTRWPVLLAATLLMAGGGYYLAVQATAHTREVVALRAAERARAASPEKISALRQALQIEPKNFETAFELGEQLRIRAWEGGENYKALAAEALGWFQQAMKLNPWDPQPCIRAGMCLDWLGQHAEAEQYFAKALQLDPNHWFSRGMMGWHYFQIENFAEARRWMDKSVEAELNVNTFAYTYREILNKKLAQSTNDAALLR